jgi:hypothetical protein
VLLEVLMIECGGFMWILVLICVQVGVCLLGGCLGGEVMYIVLNMLYACKGGLIG